MVDALIYEIRRSHEHGTLSMVSLLLPHLREQSSRGFPMVFQALIWVEHAILLLSTRRVARNVPARTEERFKKAFLSIPEESLDVRLWLLNIQTLWVSANGSDYFRVSWYDFLFGREYTFNERVYEWDCNGYTNFRIRFSFQTCFGYLRHWNEYFIQSERLPEAVYFPCLEAARGSSAIDGFAVYSLSWKKGFGFLLLQYQEHRHSRVSLCP